MVRGVRGRCRQDERRDPDRGWQTGVCYVEDLNLDVLLVTLRKVESRFTPTTMYADAFVSPTHFHWESQSLTARNSAAGRRYLSGSSSVTLFVRIEHDERYMALGRLLLEKAEGDRPIRIDWRLENRVPEAFYVRAMRIAA